MNRLPLGTVSYIQRMLRKVSYYDDAIKPVIPDGIYGEQTRSSVESFQKRYSMPETGEVDNDTWDKLVEVFSDTIKKNELVVCIDAYGERDKPLYPGEAYEILYVIQAMMLALSERFSNLDKVFVTGIYDKSTSEAVRRIQILSGITPNDMIDREFVNSLAELYNTFVTRNRVENLAPENRR